MRIRSPKDFWAGLIFIAIGGGFVLLAQQYRLGDMHRMGPAMFPTLVGALLVLLGLIIALRAFAFDGAPVPRFYLADRGFGVGDRPVRGRAAVARAHRCGRCAGPRRRLRRPRRAPIGESRAGGGDDPVFGRGLRLAAGPAAAALAEFVRPEWKRSPISRSVWGWR